MVARLILDLTRHGSEIPDAQSERILAQASDLAISLFATSANAEYADARHRTMLDRIKGHIETHFRDPGLTPDEIAAAANISTRYAPGDLCAPGAATRARRPTGADRH